MWKAVVLLQGNFQVVRRYVKMELLPPIYCVTGIAAALESVALPRNKCLKVKNELIFELAVFCVIW